MKADCSSITLITFSLVHTEEWFNRNFEITLKEIRKPQDDIRDLRKEISEFKVNLELN